MEIFLLLIIILVMVIFGTSRNSKLNELERTLSGIEAYLKKISHTLAEKASAKPEVFTKAEKTTAEPEKFVPEEEKEEEAPVPDREVEMPPVFRDFGLTPPLIVEEHVEEGSPEEQEPEPESVPEETVEEEEQEEIREAEPEPEVVQEELVEEEVLVETKRSSTVTFETREPVVVPEEDWYTRFRRNNPDIEKFIGENILSKVAITILVLGVAFFVKFAIDKEWINEAARVGIGILCGAVVLGFAHRLRAKFKAFSSVLVAGGIAIFYFTIGIGFHQYHIFSQTAAFVIMFLITAFSVFISVSYDRIELAVLSIIGGFATPFIVSTGQGNYQVLFIYILILDLGMLVLAYLRKWNLVNILTYVFTMLLYIVWLESKVMSDPRGPYEGALLFGSLFYVVFVLMNIVNNVKEKRKFDAFELSMLLSNTFLFYGEGMHILNYYNPQLQGLFSACMAVFNLVCAWLLYKKFRADEKLVYLMIGLTLTFITICAPVQLEGNYITLFWALESLLLMWLAQRSGIVLYRFTSVIVMSLMIISLGMDWTQVYKQYVSGTLNILLNKGFITGLVSALSIGGTALLLKKESRREPHESLYFWGIEFHPKNYSSLLRFIFILLLYFTGLFELVYQLKERMQGDAAFAIVVEAYHLLFVLALNYGLARHKNYYIKNTLYYLNLVMVVVFVVGFTLVPVFDFKENMLHNHMNYTGFVFHYVCLAAAVVLSIRIFKMIRQKEVDVSYNPSLFPTLISLVLTYICSTELILHVAQLRLSGSGGDVLQKYSEFRALNMQVVKIGFPILWGILAFIFLSVGMKKHIKAFRISGLVLIAIILVKLFTYDIRNASEAGKIVAFIILGVVLLIISFMYQKIKALLIDDSKKKETTDPSKPD